MKQLQFRATLNKEARGTYDRYQTEIILFGLEDLMRGKVVFAYPEHWQFDRWTGLKDKNGKEIYEGDLYSYGIRISEVIWDYTGWKLKPKMQDGKPWEYDTVDPMLEDGEVIGNIYEQPHLLTNENE